MENFFFLVKVFCLISTFQYTLNKIDINSKNIIGYDNTDPNDTYPFSDDENHNKDSEKPSVLEITIHYAKNEQIGNKGAILFSGSQTIGFHFEKEFSRKTYFTNKIFDINNKTYNINCGPWIIDEDFSIFCEFEESIPKGEYSIEFENITFDYSDIQIELYSDRINRIIKVDYNMVDIYSEIQTINLTDNKEEYELNYYVNSYYNEQLYFQFNLNIIQLNCNQKNNVLTCLIKRDIIENRLSIENNNEINLYYFDRDGLPQKCEFSFINMIHNNEKADKTDIFVGITNLLTRNDIGYYGVISFETNVTEISNVDIWFYFELFENESGTMCRFLKGDKKPMIFNCFLIGINNQSNKNLLIKEYKSEFIFNESVKYNFRIQPIKQNYTFSIKLYKEPYILKSYPEVLDFTKKDSYKIEFISVFPNYLTGVTFNEKKEDLKCENKEMIKSCKVAKDHFEGLKTDYYYIKHDYLNNKEILYELVPVKVILPQNSNKNSIKIISILVAIIIIIIIVIYMCRKNSCDLKEKILKLVMGKSDKQEEEKILQKIEGAYLISR